MFSLAVFHRWPWALIFALWLSIPCSARPPEPTGSIRALAHRVFHLEDGLPQSTVMALAQTPDGYLWLGTEAGLARFDGTRFVTFRGSEVPGTGSNVTRALHVDEKGTLWIGTLGRGLLRYKAGTFNIQPLSPSQGEIRCLASEPRSGLWVGTSTGLYQLNGGSIRTYAKRDGLAGEHVTALLASADGSIWIGTEGGLQSLRGGRLSTPMLPPSPRAASVLSLAEGPAGILWVGTPTGLFRLEGESLARVPTQGLPGTPIQSLHMDGGGSLWIGTTEAGLVRLSRGVAERFAVADGLTHSWVLSLFEDQEGNFWAGTFSGLNAFGHSLFTKRRSMEPLRDKMIWCILPDRQGSLWFGTDSDGLFSLRNGELKALPLPPGIASSKITSLEEGADGSLWIGTFGKGILRLQGKALTRFTTGNGLPSDRIRCMKKDAKGVLWAGTTAGLARFENGRFKVEEASPLNSRMVTLLFSGHDGRIWAGLDRAGLFNRFGDKWEKSIPNGTPSCAWEAIDGALWIAMLGEGLVQLKNGKSTKIGARAGLWDDQIFTILPDEHGHLWMTCNRGIFRVPLQDLEDVVEGRRPVLSSVGYGRAEGMPGGECAGGGSPSGVRTAQGTLWFPAVRGPIEVDPSQAHESRTNPRALIERILADGQELAYGTYHSIPSRIRRLEIEFTGMSLLAPERPRFRYRLLGFENEWIEAGSSRKAVFTHLPPGAFTFEIIPDAPGASIGASGASWRFQVTPPFIRTPLFYALCGLFTAALAWGVHHSFLQKIRAQNAILTERNRIAREIHDSVGQGLTGIVLQLQAATAYPGKAFSGDSVMQALGLATATLAETRRALTDLRPSLLEVGALTESIQQLISTLLLPEGLAMAFQIEGTPWPLTKADQHQLYRIAEESLTNALRHSGADRVEVRMKWTRLRMVLSIRDNGHGLWVQGGEQQPGSMGLRGMFERARMLGCPLMIRTIQGTQTEIRIIVPRCPRRMFIREKGDA